MTSPPGSALQVVGRDHLQSWSRDGSRIVFDSDRSGDTDLYIMTSAGGNVQQIVDSPERDEVPVWR